MSKVLMSYCSKRDRKCLVFSVLSSLLLAFAVALILYLLFKCVPMLTNAHRHSVFSPFALWRSHGKATSFWSPAGIRRSGRAS